VEAADVDSLRAAHFALDGTRDEDKMGYACWPIGALRNLVTFVDDGPADA